MNWLTLAAIAAWGMCPYFAEILPDPVTVEDARGEFVEIRIPPDSKQDTLSLFYEQKQIWKGILPASANRLLLIRDTLLCPEVKSLHCAPLNAPALPNRREMRWMLLNGNCSDTADFPIPKAGKSFVRSDSSKSSWELAEPSPGIPNAIFESGVKDCLLHWENTEWTASGWKGSWTLTGCDSAEIHVEFLSMESSAEKSFDIPLKRDLASVWETSLSAKALLIRLALPPDDIPGNDSLDTLLFTPGNFPVRLTEVHPCPEEGLPEWFELYNAGSREISLSSVNLCEPEKSIASQSVLAAKQSAVVTKDSSGMRHLVGTDEILILQHNFGYLKNAADSLYLCYGNEKVDSAIWGKSAKIQVNCPDGFSVGTGRRENSPGFQTPGSLVQDTALPFQVEWNARIFSKKTRANPLMLRIQSEEDVLIELISGKGDLLWKKTFPADAGGNSWREVPLLEKGFPGPNFIRVSSQNREKRIGVVLRP